MIPRRLGLLPIPVKSATDSQFVEPATDLTGNLFIRYHGGGAHGPAVVQREDFPRSASIRWATASFRARQSSSQTSTAPVKTTNAWAGGSPAFYSSQ